MILNTETSKRLKSKNIYAQIYEFLRKIRSSRYSYSCYSKRETGYPVLIPEEIEKLAKDRWDAKLNKNWALADELRDKILQKGY